MNPPAFFHCHRPGFNGGDNIERSRTQRLVGGCPERPKLAVQGNLCLTPMFLFAGLIAAASLALVRTTLEIIRARLADY